MISTQFSGEGGADHRFKALNAGKDHEPDTVVCLGKLSYILKSHSWKERLIRGAQIPEAEHEALQSVVTDCG